ncbi:Hydroxymethylglutaryl-CoA lyase YngG [compost metagenome]|jgi:hydroxymethylglutaryl-CoA lyase|uniref:hydroxymethylglutaryl-CoA lyase n=1 Tax=Pseudomonas TaxID=286 RepID=UPI000F9ED1D2|nr:MULTISPECIES: hydroxymethylglutaryl-CoA lyase [Pseudomonas]WPN32227.1 hydroxymethylglutaryl-CoA lyase [Pseudomonas sp. P5_109]VVP20641.1 Hydroxymethylglutaryl-CoA lyase YngG [Pseudomonas fluorescens]
MRDVTLCECFARDGLQHEPNFLPTPTKRRLVERFAEIGFQRVEATSYSNPAVIPQFADASSLLATLQRRAGVFYKATCANVRAVERAVGDLSAGHGANEISLLVSASESHSLKNLKRSRADQWLNIQQMAEKALNQFRLIGTVSVAFGCPFEGRVSEASVLADVEQFAKRGVKFVTLGDTTGVATPQSVKRLFSAVLATFPEITPIAHFHDTRATGLVNYVAALEAGVTWYDCAFGGVGGHPAKVKYGGGHTGNVSTEDWVNLLESMGVRTGIDLDRLLDVAAECEAALGRELHSRVLRSGLNPLLPTTVSQTTSSNEEV